MLKKAGIVVAATTAGFLALAPLAFADEEVDNSVEIEQSNDCDFEQAQSATGATGALPGILPPLTQTQTDNCTNDGVVNTEGDNGILDDVVEVLPPLPPVPPTPPTP